MNETPNSQHPIRSGLAFGAAHALLLWLAFPPLTVGIVGILAPLPLLWLAMTTRHPWRAGLGVALGTLPFWVYHHWWVFAISAAGAPPLMLIQAVWPGLFVALAAIVVRSKPSLANAAALAVLWGGVEFLRGRLFFDGYPWFLSAHPTAGLPLARWGAVIGAYGVGLLLALLCSMLLFALIRRDLGHRRWIAPGVCLLLLAAGGLIPRPVTARTITIGIVQTNLPQSNKMSRSIEESVDDFRNWSSLTVQAAREQPDLIVWPETMFPGATLSPDAIGAFAQLEQTLNFGEDRRSPGTLFVDPVLNLQEEIGVPLLLGAIGYENLEFTVTPSGEIEDRFDARYNSAFLIENGSLADARYDKIFLTPFGETMPYISSFPRLERAMLDFAARGMSFDLTAGTRPIRFPIGTGNQETVRIATPICFEATIPHVCRRLVYESGEREADLLINMTNDGWFGSFDSGRANHLLVSRWRALELGVPVVRAANTGISCVVDASGRVLQSLAPRQQEAVLIAEVPLSDPNRTIYASIGDLFGWLSFVGSLVLLVISFVRPAKPAHPHRADGPNPSEPSHEP